MTPDTKTTPQNAPDNTPIRARKTPMRLRVLGTGVLAGALFLAGCSGDDDASTDATASVTTTPTATESMSEATPTATMEAMSDTLTSETGAADLHAGLTHLLQEHVYLAANATNAALTGGDFDGAAGALDENSVALSEAIGSIYGSDAGGAFLELWRTHIGFFVDYTQARAAGDDAAAQAAVTALEGYGQDFGAFIESANPNLPADAVAEELGPHVATLTTAIDAQVAGSPDQWALLREAASHMPHTAAILAGGIVTQMPDTFDGSIDAGGAELRAGLTALLNEHVYLATFATGEAIRGGDFEGAAAGLDANSVALSEAIGSVYGDEAAGAFLELWRTHIGFFVEYTQARAVGDDAAADVAAAELDSYRTDFGAFLASANENFDVETVAADLVPHVESVFAVIDAQVAGDVAQWTLMREAAGHMPHTALMLASGIEAQSPDQFAAVAPGHEH